MEQTVKQALTDNVQYMNMRELNELIKAHDNNTLTTRQAFLMGVILGGLVEDELSGNSFSTIAMDRERNYALNDFIKTALTKTTEKL